MKGKQSKGILRVSIVVCLILLTTMVVSIMGCSSPEPAPAPSPAPAPAPAPSPAPAPAPEPITLVFTSHEPPPPNGTLAVNIFQRFFAELDKRTQGRVKIEAHWGGELVNMLDAYNAAAKGTVDLANFMPSNSPDKFPMDDVTAFCSYDLVSNRYSRIYLELFQKYPEMQAQYKDTKYLYLFNPYFCGLTTVKIPIRKLEDNKGLKMMAAGRWLGERGNSLGWVQASVPPEEMFSSLQRGILDGAPVGVPYCMVDFGWAEILKYVTMIPTAHTIMGVTMNLDTWNSLPADIQGIMTDMSDDFADYADEFFVRSHNELVASMPKDYGTEFIYLPEEEVARWVEVDMPVQEKYVAEMESKGLPGRELLNDFHQLEKKYAAEEYAIK